MKAPRVVLLLSLVAGFGACSAATPEVALPGNEQAAPPDAGEGAAPQALLDTTSTEPTVVDPAEPIADASPQAGFAPADGGPREDPVPWASLDSSFSYSTDEDTVAVDYIDLDGDGQEELIAIRSHADGLDSVVSETLVARRIEGGYRVIHSDVDDLSLVSLPGGLRGLLGDRGFCGAGTSFVVYTLQRGRNRLTVVFEHTYNNETDLAATTCTDGAGYEYHPAIEGSLVFSERDDVRVLEAVQEDRGCPGSPLITEIRFDDMLRRAGLLAPE